MVIETAKVNAVTKGVTRKLPHQVLTFEFWVVMAGSSVENGGDSSDISRTRQGNRMKVRGYDVLLSTGV